MKIRTVCALVLAMTLAAATSATLGAQRPGGENRPRANQGRLPPPPESAVPREAERLPTGHVNDTPHVNHDRWYGHDAASDARFHLDRPFEHGRFAQFGPSYRYKVERIDRDRRMFWLPGGFGFQIAAWDWPLFGDWCWDCGEDFVVYEDSTHPGWYLVYDVDTGQYVHATYMGA